MAQYNDENLTSVIKSVITYSNILFVTIFYDSIAIVIRINRHNLLNIIIVMVLYDNVHMS
jgi:predicted nucleic acid-binding OB-fold protein